jgi:hypothetical protein
MKGAIVYSPHTHSWRGQEKIYLFIPGKNNKFETEKQRM